MSGEATLKQEQTTTTDTKHETSSSSSAIVLPSDAVIRTALRTLLASHSHELHVLTPKLVRGSLVSSLGLDGASEDVLDSLRGALKAMLPEEISAVTSKKSEAGTKRKEKEKEKESEQPKKKAKKEAESPKKKSNEPDIDALAAEAEDAEEEEMTQEEKDAAFAASLAEEGRRPRRAAAPVSKPRKTPVRKPVDPNAPKKMTAISSALSDFFGGVVEMNRGDVVKELWVYIKANNLQDPADGRKIILDDKLKTLFGDKKKVDMFGMNKLLQSHMKNKHQLAD